MRKREQGFTLIEIMVVIAIIATLVTAVSVIVPTVQENSKRTESTRHMKELVSLYLNDTMGGGRPRYDGAILWLSYRKKGTIQEGQEKVLFCPGDTHAIKPVTPEDRKKYDDINLENPDSSVDTMTSYVARDFTGFPLKRDSKVLQVIGSVRQGRDGRQAHFKNGIVVAFDDSSVKFMDKEQLGIAEADEIVVGPDSPHADLMQLIYLRDKRE